MATTPTDQTAPPTTRAKKKKARDPNRVPVKRERSELVDLARVWEQAKRERAALVKRIEARAGLQAKLALLDESIAAYGDRMQALTGGEMRQGEGVAGAAELLP